MVKNSKTQLKAIRELKKLGGKTVPVTVIRRSGNISIGGKGFKKLAKHPTGNIGVSAKAVIMARKKLIRRGLNK